MKHLIIIVLASLLGIAGIYAHLVSAVAAVSAVSQVSGVSIELRDTRICEQMLDGVYAFDNARGQAFCRTATGYIAL